MKSFKNERITEEITRAKFRELGYYDEDNGAFVEEQRSRTQEIQKLLARASKTGKDGRGSPEFIVTAASTPDFVMIVECKADVKFHRSSGTEITWDQPSQFAVDGALHYASFLKESFNVIAVAISGQDSDTLEVSNYVWPKGLESPRALTNPMDVEITELISWSDYVRAGEFDPEVEKARERDLMAFSRELHDFMWKHAKLTESQKPLLVSGTLIALQEKPFTASYDSHVAPEDLQNAWLEAIKKSVERANIPNSKSAAMVQPYSSIAVHPELRKKTAAFPRGVLYELIKRLHDHVWPFISVYHDFDVVGQFYGEFLKYTGGDKKALGIVLTPRHVTELFAHLANVQKTDTVVDICAGTGGFLISAMKEMMRTAASDSERERIKAQGLIGVEQQPDMFALAASNMILRGDGKANLYQGDCFEAKRSKLLKAHHANVGMINPPYSQKDEDLHELQFVGHMLDLLVEGGRGLAIVPMSRATTESIHKTKILRKHTLEAVMSMPVELFAPVGTVTCIMVFTAHKPHAHSNKKTWFGYWREDGFTRTKHLGRVDLHGQWTSIRDRWVEMFRNREIHEGESVLHQVGPHDEWCAEAYLETNYDHLSSADFERVMREYAVYKMIHDTELKEVSK